MQSKQSTCLRSIFCINTAFNMMGFNYISNILSGLKESIYNFYCKIIGKEVVNVTVTDSNIISQNLFKSNWFSIDYLFILIVCLIGILLLFCSYCLWKTRKNKTLIRNLEKTVTELVLHKEFVTSTLLALIERQELQESLEATPPMEPIFEIDPFMPIFTRETKNTEDDTKSRFSVMSTRSNLTLPLRTNKAERLRLAAGQTKKDVVPKFMPKRVNKRTA